MNNYQIDIKTAYGKYLSFIKEFASEQHMTNWSKLVFQKHGWKVIGSQIIK
jgi:hypothetical protein